ncbi:MAG: YhcH/YjgK/YiaL family protein [Opitutales bacterium]
MEAQTGAQGGFARAFAYLGEVRREGSEARRRILAMATGTSQRIDLGEGVFAIEQSYETKARADGFFESHRRLVDVQVVVAGEEVMEVADIAKLPVKQAYDAERDVITYGDFGAASRLRFAAGEAAVFFPLDGHMPCLRVGASSVLVRKTVVKVPVPA